MSPHDSLKDPAMIAAADEIVPILQKHNLMAMLFLSSETRSGFIMEISPTWSCITKQGDRINVRCKAKDYPSQEVQSKVLAASVGGIMGILHCSKDVLESMEGMVAIIGSQVDITSIICDPDLRPSPIDLDPPPSGS